MAYKTDGSSHRNGIKNEKQQIKYLKSGAAHSVVTGLSEGFQIIPKGGTKFKEDFQIVDGDTVIKVSAKRKKKMSTGSYDYVNSSKVMSEIDSLSEVSSFVKKLRTAGQSKSTTRRKFNAESNRVLDSLEPSEISTILIDHVAKKNEGIRMMITDKTANTSYWYKFEESQMYKDVVRLLDDDYGFEPELVFGRGKTSAKIIFKNSEGEKIDHNLRIRLVLNNGVGALLGLSKSNKNAIATIKIQQDRCDKMMARLQKQNIVTVF
tara:strand:+ start:1110 stop:1901 length:792 start_codon:yes stop_codon:yes gene_type:complete